MVDAMLFGWMDPEYGEYDYHEDGIVKVGRMVVSSGLAACIASGPCVDGLPTGRCMVWEPHEDMLLVIRQGKKDRRVEAASGHDE